MGGLEHLSTTSVDELLWVLGFRLSCDIVCSRSSKQPEPFPYEEPADENDSSSSSSSIVAVRLQLLLLQSSLHPVLRIQL